MASAAESPTRAARPEPFLTDGDDFKPLGTATPGDRPSAAATTDAPEETVSTRTQRDPARPNTSKRATRTNRTAIWALVLSLLGITAPIGLILGYRARSTIARTGELGGPFARVAIWIGWLYIIVLVAALGTYFWISGQGS
ncbi:DUF4190 domain-containing protein [Gordonia rhizosphera]|uniref:DUF4190 domain-containing protein n=1 Tax=Gordonia rhizosphera NBRC 16068 TaxID=1108045 RepID=K6W708_9ACTN|nr:DUF4190 domain-containing protein [Gordonia rhizosphera]GAB89511.1 hypothetical protein GORHZ_063_00050 [Gordonia rhizosphera NBRC 16068]